MMAAVNCLQKCVVLNDHCVSCSIIGRRVLSLILSIVPSHCHLLYSLLCRKNTNAEKVVMLESYIASQHVG